MMDYYQRQMQPAGRVTKTKPGAVKVQHRHGTLEAVMDESGQRRVEKLEDDEVDEKHDSDEGDRHEEAIGL